jgi:DNA polymerase I-like protein with 3'-5' exonuclease and polymerase domains
MNMSVIAIDTETTGLNFLLGAEPFMVTACDDSANLFYWEFEIDPLTKKIKRNRTTMRDIQLTLKQYDSWVFHNANFDLRALATLFHIPVQDIKKLHKHPDEFWNHIHDTLLMSHVLDNVRSHGLKDLSVRYLKFPKDDEDNLKESVIAARRVVRSLHRKGAIPDWQIHDETEADYWLPKLVFKAFPDLAKPHWNDVCLSYALKDVERTISLYTLFTDILKKRGTYETYLQEIQTLKVVTDIQSRGMNFLRPVATRVLNDLENHIEQHSQKLTQKVQSFGLECCNFESPKQLQTLMYDVMKFPVVAVTDKGKPSTDAATLQQLVDCCPDHPHIDFLVYLKELKLNLTSSKYIRNYLYFAIPSQEGKRIRYTLYPNLNQTGTKTTRFSCSNPNGQNISTGKEEEDDTGHKIKRFNLRELFGPPPGYVWYAIDYSSLQLIIFAYEANDSGMIDAFAKGYDFHNYVACGLFNTKEPTKNERRIAKNVNYALIFGAGASRVNATAGMDGAYELYQNQFPIVAEYMEKISYQVRKTGQVKTAFGYPLLVPREQPYKGVNYIVQGDEGNIVKRSMALCNDFLNTHSSKSRLIMQIHDELVFECPKGKKFPLNSICNLMMSPAREIGWITPVGASLVTTHWGDKKELVVSI